MPRMTRNRSANAWVFVLLLLAAGVAAGESLYVKEADWPATMLSTRARYAERSAAKGERAGFKPWDSGVMRGNAPGKPVSVALNAAEGMCLVGKCVQGTGNCHIWGDPVLIAADGTRTPLTSLKPVSAKVGWGSLLQNRNWQNHPLRIGKREFKQGVWVHADSEVFYRLGGKYERFEAWVGCDKDRPVGAARFQVLDRRPDAPSDLWRRIAKDFPVEAKWFADDLGRRSDPAQWLRQKKDTKLEQRVLGKALAALGAAGEPLRKELAALKKQRVGGDDGRWLDLYVRACRGRDCASALATIAQADGDLADRLRKDLAALLGAKATPANPRWADLTGKVGRIRKALVELGGGRLPDVEGLAASVRALTDVCPERFPGGEKLLAGLAEIRVPWQAALAALQSGAKGSAKQTADLFSKLTALQRDVRLGLDGVKAYLAAHDHVDLEAEWRAQHATLSAPVPTVPAEEVYRPEALRLPSDRDPLDIVLRRTAALLAHLAAGAGEADGELAACARELSALRDAAVRVDPKRADARYALFAAACMQRRRIAFHNPLLDFDRLLFIKRHRSTFNHMCDQYYGINAVAGGGLYVLANPFGPGAEVRDVLADAAVANGRLKGKLLAGGSFLSPDVSWDGRRVAFAYVECTGDRKHVWHTETDQRGYWTIGRSYHVFTVDVDPATGRAKGGSLAQLTDGTWNDFDPVWLPNGRLGFISERRGGYLRCGRTCPTYTLHDMADDGSDIRRLSPHETNEWHPSMTHGGLIIYTRWDYVDRHGCTAHLPWVTTLDGRDSRAVHGNFAPRRSRPDMEVDIRAIPNSNRLVATAAPHHGQAFGSLVLVDPDIEDDDGMAPVLRITPDVGFPESQGGKQAYGSPWPLSEDFHLCVYDPTVARGDARHGRQGAQDWERFRYGIYVVDAFGNRVLVYRDPEIACLNPMPLRPRTKPPVMPQFVQDGPFLPTPAKVENGTARRPADATVAVMDVYHALKGWPEGTKISALRVFQIVPMSVPSGGPPHEMGLRLPTAGDSVNPGRYVLGTVPVQPDGSASFRVPANVELFFQALDENGLAVQSMRSSTYAKPGETLFCHGCHDRRHVAPAPPKNVPLALRTPPRTLKPDVEGSNPFSYPRLVQPVLDKRCVPCHTKNAPKAPDLTAKIAGSGRRRWYASYESLAKEHGFWRYGHAYRTTPGNFGAHVSKLYQMLQKGHHKVKLTDEERHRIALWLDCSSLFYGVFEKTGGEAQLAGKVVLPTLE